MTTTKPRQRRQLVDETEAAARLGVPVQSLRDARSRRTGELAQLGFFRVGRRIRYDDHEISDYVEAHRVPPAEEG